jgi:hypothetical protein
MMIIYFDFMCYLLGATIHTENGMYMRIKKRANPPKYMTTSNQLETTSNTIPNHVPTDSVSSIPPLLSHDRLASSSSSSTTMTSASAAAAPAPAGGCPFHHALEEATTVSTSTAVTTATSKVAIPTFAAREIQDLSTTSSSPSSPSTSGCPFHSTP